MTDLTGWGKRGGQCRSTLDEKEADLKSVSP